MEQRYLNVGGDIEAAKTRYYALKQKGQEAGEKAPLPRNADTITDTVLTDTLPGGSYWHGRIARGRTLRLTNTNATQGVAVLLYNAHDISERFNAGDTVKVQWSARLGHGNLLLSAMGRALATITDDRCGYHDAITGHSTKASNAARYGADHYHRNAQDAFILAAMKYGMNERDVCPSISFFAPVSTGDDEQFFWEDGKLAPGQFVDLRAEMDLIALVANCPHPMAPGAAYDPKPIDIAVWQSGAATPGDPFVTATEEAARAFDNSFAYLEECPHG